MNPIQIARFYLMARGRGNANYEEDLEALTGLLLECGMAGRRGCLEWCKDRYRELHPGGCRLLSQGESCQCFLCQCDEEMKRIR